MIELGGSRLADEVGRQPDTQVRHYPHSEVTQQIIGGFYEVYNELGYGFLESVYKAALFRDLKQRGLCPAAEAPVPVRFRGEKVGDLCADLVVNQSVVIELKAVRVLEPYHEAQLLNYPRSTPIEIGLLMNFGPRPVVRRLAFSNDRKKISVNER